MSPEAIVMMAVCWTAIIGLSVFCLARILRSQ